MKKDFIKRVLMAAASGFTLAGFAAAEAADAPAMWKMTDKDSTVYLFGTFHILPAELEWKTEAYEKAMAEATTTYAEADALSPEAQAAVQAAVQQYGLNPPGVTLSSVLGEERAEQLAEVAQQYGVPMQALEPYRPWLASLTLAVVAFQKAGFDPQSGVEQVLLAQAAEEGDAIDYFETATQQIEMLASLDEEEMLNNFDASMEQFENFEALSKKMLDAWSTGDVKALDEDILGDLRDEAPDAYQKLIVNRNAAWIADLKTIMDGEGDYFIAVGAGHLVGDDSVIKMLKDEGFKVKRIQ